MDGREKQPNEKRLIDADALMDVIRQHEYRLATKNGSIDYGMFTLGIQQAVDEQPTVDAVEVVRCRNCRKWKNRGKDEILDTEIGRCDCSHWKNDYYNIETEADDFCSYGERKEGAD